MKLIRNEREANRLMREHYPHPSPGAHYMPRANRSMTRDDWEMFGGYMLGCFNFCLYSWLLIIFFLER